jgi:hypothetical protein
MSDEFTWWRAALRGEAGPIHADHPHSGYYKTRAANGRWMPVAIWLKDGAHVCRVGNESKSAVEVWTHAAKNPVPKDDARQAFETGTWPGDAPDIGHNQGPMTIAEEINDYAEHTLEWLRSTTIDSKPKADEAANRRAKLLELSKTADKERDEKKRPHLEAGRKIDAEYKPLVETATKAANAARDALTVYMKAEEARQRAEQEAKRKAAEEVARKIREAAEAARAKAEAENMPPPEVPEVTLPMFDEPVKVQAGGQRGRKAGLRTITKYIVTDYAAALAHVKDHPDVRAAVEKIAAAQAKAGATVPGVEAQHEQVAA